MNTFKAFSFQVLFSGKIHNSSLYPPPEEIKNRLCVQDYVFVSHRHDEFLWGIQTVKTRERLSAVDWKRKEGIVYCSSNNHPYEWVKLNLPVVCWLLAATLAFALLSITMTELKAAVAMTYQRCMDDFDSFTGNNPRGVMNYFACIFWACAAMCDIGDTTHVNLHTNVTEAAPHYRFSQYLIKIFSLLCLHMQNHIVLDHMSCMSLKPTSSGMQGVAMAIYSTRWLQSLLGEWASATCLTLRTGDFCSVTGAWNNVVLQLLYWCVCVCFTHWWIFYMSGKKSEIKVSQDCKDKSCCCIEHMSIQQFNENINTDWSLKITSNPDNTITKTSYYIYYV